MQYKTISTISKELANKDYTSVELTQEYLDRINTHDKNINSFISVTAENALKQAENADEQIQSGNATPLTGIPLAIKDIFCTEGIKTTCASKMLSNFVAPYESTATHKLNHAGAVMLGKANMDEFAMGGSNENSFYGACKNPWDATRVPGGSSGGSAAAVASGFAPGALGTDTGGSIRQPAAFCGITGLKPSYGRVSRYGMIAFASSLDQGGPMAHTAEDVALILQTIAGHDPKDSTSVNEPVPNYSETLNDSVKGLKIGLPKEYFETEGLDPAIKTAVQNALKELEKQGAILKEVSLPRTQLCIPAYYVIAPAEASSNLARYDGVRYGYRCDNPKDLLDLYKRSRSEGFGDEVKRRIMIGTYALSAGYYDAYYIKAQQIRRLIADDFKTAFKEVDVIAGPTTPNLAFKIGEKIDDPVSMYLEDIYTISVNLAGLPGMSVPVGFENNLPIGMQLIGPYLSEAKLLNVAHQFQQITDWHTKTPSLAGE